MELSLLEAFRTSQVKRFLRHELCVATRASRLMADRALVCSQDGERLMRQRGFVMPYYARRLVIIRAFQGG